MKLLNRDIVKLEELFENICDKFIKKNHGKRFREMDGKNPKCEHGKKCWQFLESFRQIHYMIADNFEENF